jgi:chemotaxis protein MotB
MRPVKKSRAPEVVEDDSQRWLGTYGDAVTLLMAFFVMLYAMSETDSVKFTAFLTGLEGPFGNSAIENILPTGTGIVGPNTPAEAVPDQISMEQLVADTLNKSSLDDSQEAQLEDVEQALETAFGEQGLGSVADYRVTSRGLVISIASDDVLFSLGSSDVSAVGFDIVGTLSDVLAGYPNDVTVEGHTDNAPLSRAGYSNWNLSTDRAVAVLDLLIEQHDFPAQRLGAAGYADQRPRAENDTPANRSLNRRVDILIVAEGIGRG